MAFRSIPQVIEAAQHSLAPEIWDLAAGAAGTESTARRNRDALARILFRPRVLIDVGNRHTVTTLLAQELTLPVLLAPIGTIGLFEPTGALAPARAAARAGTIAFVSVMADPSLEEVAEASSGPKILQITPSGGDLKWMQGVCGRAAQSGYLAVCLTVETPPGSQDRNLRNDFSAHSMHRYSNFSSHPDNSHQYRMTWREVAELREKLSVPLVLKGITTAEDAERAIEHGVDIVYVSNHGGLRLDYAPASIEVLSEVIPAVRGRVPVIVDGGFMRGPDVVKAIALGATAVVIGRLQCFALAAGGVDELVNTLELLRGEISSTMALIGVNNLIELDQTYIRPTTWIPGE